MSRVLMIGLDSVPPSLAFERYRHIMPNLSHLMDTGCYGPLLSTTPPITVPAWASLLSGYDPGELGIYGFRKREPGQYVPRLISSHDLQKPMLWERLPKQLRACVLFVPPSFPPRAMSGELVSCFLTPDAATVHTFPETLGEELRARFGPYQPDVDEYRTDDRARLLTQLYAGTAQRFAIAEHLLSTRKPDLTIMVEIGPDRFHHAFLAHVDATHPKHAPNNPYVQAGLEYYAFLDQQLGTLLQAAGPDTTVLVASDHGVRPLLGNIHINQWLIEHGYLVLERYPQQLSAFSALEVDWSRTRAFGEGGYCARVSLNIAGREPHGIVPESEAPALAAQIARQLQQLSGPDGVVRPHRIVTPHECYREVQGLPADLMVFFGDLAYRASGAVGGGMLYSETNDTGPDACNHDWHGIFVLSGPTVSARGPLAGVHHRDVAVTVLGALGVAVDDLAGKDRRGS